METSPPTGPSIGSPPPPTPPPFGTPRPRQLRRRPDDGPIAGVCAGVAEYFNVDPVIVRIAMVVLALSGPGVVAYVLAWIFVPAATDAPQRPVGTDDLHRRDRGAQIFGIVLLAIAVSVLWGDWWSPARQWLLPFGLIALGAWLILRRDGAADETSTDGAGPASAVAAIEGGADADDGPTLQARGDVPSSTAPPSTPTSSIPLPPWSQPSIPLEGDRADGNRVARRRRGMLGPIVMGALLVWTGIAWLSDVSVESGLAVALCILGVGFVLGAFVGGSWALVVPAFGIGAALVVATVADIPLSGPVGDHTWAPKTIADVQDRYELSVGEGTLDLRGLDLAEGDQLEIAASVGIGHLVVLLPDGVSYVAEARVAVGEAALDGAADQGVGVDTRSGFQSDGDVGSIDLDLHVGLGQIELRSRLPVSRPAAPR